MPRSSDCNMPYEQSMLNILLAASILASQSSLPVLSIAAPQGTMHLWISRSERQHEFGLMERTHLDPGQGMIFVFKRSNIRFVWMKDTLIPLDMVFVGHDGTVRAVVSRVPVLPPNIPDRDIPMIFARAQYVIELGAGEALRLGIVAGEKLKIPTTI